MIDSELEKMLSQRHKEFVLFDLNDKKVPCIILEETRFDNIMRYVAGRPVSVETSLNILQDGLGHVFVKMRLDFSLGGITEEFLLYEKEYLEYFDAIADSSILA